MYSVSQEFIAEMKKPAQKRTIRGSIGGINFYAKNIVKGSCKITNQCSDDNYIQIGQVYIGQLKITLRGIQGISRKSYKGKEIILYQGLYVNGVVEEVLLGHWFVDNATLTTSGVVIVAYDAMTKFDRTSVSFPSSGTMREYVTYACTVCGVELEKIDESAVNTSIQYYMHRDNDIETWRDLLSWISQASGCNAIVNRYGRLEICCYSGRTPVDLYNSKRRLSGGKFSDFDTYYTGLSVVNIDNQTTTYYGMLVDDGLTMNLGSNPFLQQVSYPNIGRYRRNVLNSISTIRFTPCNVRLNALMIYDLMDVLTFNGGIIGDGEDINVCITKFTWNLNGDYVIQCSGSNPSLVSAKSKTDKNLVGLLSKVVDNEITYYDFINIDRIDISDNQGKVTVADIRYAVKKDSHIDLHAEIKYTLVTKEITDNGYNINNDGKIKVTYYIDGQEVEEYHPIETNTDGIHLLHLLFFWNGLSGTTGRVTICIEAYDCDIIIDASSCRGFISGQGLVGTESWDGILEVEDNFRIIGYKTSLSDIIDSADVSLNIPTMISYTDVFRQPIRYRNNLSRVTDNADISKGMIFATNVNLSLLSYTATITNNTFVDGEVITPNVYDIEKVKTVSSGVAYYASFDSGTTWKAYSNGGWVDGSSMTATELANVPQSAWLSPAMLKAEIIDTAYLTYIQIEGGHI